MRRLKYKQFDVNGAGMVYGSSPGVPVHLRYGVSSGNWILQTGFWDDNGAWKDTSEWID